MKQTKIFTKKQLIATLKDMIDVIEQDDSFEGRITYTCMSPDEHSQDQIPNGSFEVNVFYRIGNSVRQGGSISTLH